MTSLNRRRSNGATHAPWMYSEKSSKLIVFRTASVNNRRNDLNKSWKLLLIQILFPGRFHLFVGVFDPQVLIFYLVKWNTSESSGTLEEVDFSAVQDFPYYWNKFQVASV